MQVQVSKTQAEPLWPSPVATGLLISNPSAVDVYLSTNPEALDASVNAAGTPSVGTKIPATTTVPLEFSRYKGTLWARGDGNMVGNAYLDVETYGI